MAVRAPAARRRPPRRRTYHHGDLRRALLDASVAIIESEGVSQLTLRAAARGVGVSHMAPRHHFGDLWGLLCAITEEGFRKLREHLLRVSDTEGDPNPLRAFKRIGVAYVEFAVRNPGHFRAMFQPAITERPAPPALQQAADAAYAILIDAVRRAQDAGQIRAGDTRDLALAAWALVHGLAALAVDGQLANKGAPDAMITELADRVTDQLYRGLHPPGTGG